MNHVITEKIQSIQQCIYRVREELREAGDEFKSDYSRQDAAILNILRACELTIDLANHVIRIEKLEAPSSSRGSFEILARTRFTSVNGEQSPIQAGERVRWPAGRMHRLWTEESEMVTLCETI